MTDTATAPTPSVIRNEPVQARAQARLKSIEDAARKHYEEVGRDRFNTASVAELAGCSIGTIYRYFEDRVAILDTLFPDRDVAATKLEAIRATVEGKTNTEMKLMTIESILNQ